MNSNAELNLSTLRTRLLEKRNQQQRIDTNRGGLLIRGRLFTWLATTRTRLKEQGKPLPNKIAAFWSLENEPELQPLLYQLVEEEGIEISLPCIQTPDNPLVFKPWHPEINMKTGLYGIKEPDTNELAALPDLVLVPTLGFTRQGDRLGYGKGYYDRTLAQFKQQNHPFNTIGIAWAVGDLSAEPYQAQAHDIPLDGILTDKGWAKPLTL